MDQDDETNQKLFKALDNLEAFKLQGRDKRGRRILRIVGRFLPAGALKEEVLRRYLQERILPGLLGRFCVVYVHTGGENFRGVSVLRSVYESLPGELEAVYFVHPGLQARLFLATLGRFLFGAGLYGKVKYIGRLVYLWEHMRRGEIEIPEFVIDHDEELEHRPFMDYGIESDHHRIRDASVVDSAASMYSLCCIS